MPNFGDWICTGTTSVGTTYPWTWDMSLRAEEIAVNEEYIRECERQDHMMEQMMREQAELEEDKKKYPLFFWRETCAKRTLKEGMV